MLTRRSSTSSDAELTAVLRTSAGPPPDVRASDAAFGELFRRHRKPVLAYARTCCRDPHTAEDLTSEAFTRTLRAVHSGRGPTDAWRPYLLTTVRHTAAAWWDTTRRTDLSPDFERWLEDLTGGETTESGEDRVLRQETETLVLRAFRRLPERWQTVLWHTTVEEEPAAQVAERLGISPGGIASLASRAREGLREAYLAVHAERTDRATGSDECRRYSSLLAASVRRTGRRTNRDLQRHLDQCEHCRHALLEMSELNNSLRSVLPVAVLLFGGGAYLTKTATAAGLATTGIGLGTAATGPGSGSAAAGAGSAGASAGAGSAGASAGAGSAGAGSAGASAGAGGAGAGSAGAGSGSAGAGAGAGTAATGAGGAGSGAGAAGAGGAGSGATGAAGGGAGTAGGGAGVAGGAGVSGKVVAAGISALTVTAIGGGILLLPDDDQDRTPRAGSASTPAPERPTPTSEPSPERSTSAPSKSASPPRSPSSSPSSPSSSPTPSTHRPAADARTGLRVMATGHCMDIGNEEGAMPRESACTGAATQNWELLMDRAAQQTRIRNQGTGMCLTYTNSGADGSPVRQRPCNSRTAAPSMNWTYYKQADAPGTLAFAQKSSSVFLGLNDWNAAAEGKPHSPLIGTTQNYYNTESLRFRHDEGLQL